MTSFVLPPAGPLALPRGEECPAAGEPEPDRRHAEPTGQIEAQLGLISAIMTGEAEAETLALALNRLRVICGEQSAALEGMIGEEARLQGETQELRSLIRLAPVPILRIEATLAVDFANDAARRFFGDSIAHHGAAALRRSLSRPNIARLMTMLDAAELRGSGGQGGALLRFSLAEGVRRKARVTVLGARKQRPASEGSWWLVLEPESPEELSSVDLLRHLLDANPDPVSVTDLTGRVVVANRAFVAATGQTADRVLGQQRQAFLPLIEALHHGQLDTRVRASQTEMRFEETRNLPTAPGTPASWARLHTEKRPLFDEFGRVVGVVTQSHDVTEELRARELAEMVFDHSSDAIVLTDPDLRVLRVNAAFEQIAGFGFAQLAGRGLDRLIVEPGPGPEPGSAIAAPPGPGLRGAMSDPGPWRGELVLRSSEGKLVTCWSRIDRLTDATGVLLGHVAMFSDLTLLRQAQADNLRLANFDLLTGLPNRQLLAGRVEGWIGLAERTGRVFSLLFIDLDQFKSVNDSLGHETGDLLLNAVAQRLRSGLGEQHFTARIGGDEFVILLGDTDAQAAQAMALHLLERLGAPLDLPGLHQYRPAASVGIASFGAHGETHDVLLRNADLAMYAAKISRRPVMVYDAAMGIDALRELELRNALAGAVERGELVLHFQPLFRLANRSLCGCEALMRWNRPGRGLIQPGEFLPVASRAGLMPVLDRWVLRRAVTVLAEWRGKGLLPEGWMLSINQTAADLAAPDWVETLTQALSEAGCEEIGADGGVMATGLQIELTEDQLAHGVPEALETLERLRSLGVRLAIDDFGTGYSCLAYLARLPVSMLKIDADFVRGIAENSNSRLIVEAITALAQQFGFSTLAEGIETEAEEAVLAGIGCEMGQGFLLSQPLPQEAFEARFLRGAGIP